MKVKVTHSELGVLNVTKPHYANGSKIDPLKFRMNQLIPCISTIKTFSSLASYQEDVNHQVVGF